MAVFELGDKPPPFPCHAVDERESGTWECINDDCHGGHYFRRIITDEDEAGE